MTYVRNFLTGILFLLLWNGNIYGQTASDRVLVLEQGEIAEIPSRLESELRDSPSSAATESLLAWYNERGYLDAVADTFYISDRTRTWEISSNCRYRISSVEIKSSAQSRFEPLSYLKDRYFDQTVIRNAIEDQLRELDQQGYLLADIEIRSIMKNSQTCETDLVFEIAENDAVTLKGLLFQGVERNDPEFLEMISGLREGMTITPETMVQGRRNLMDSDLFNDVTGPELVFSGGEAYLRYSVTEQRLNFFDALFGYVPKSDGSPQFAGNAELILRNVITDGSRLDIYYEQLRPMHSRLNLSAQQQYAGGLPIGFGGSLRFLQEDTLYQVMNVEVTTTYRLFTGFELIGSYRNERTVTGDEAALQPASLNSRGHYGGLGFRYRQLDRFLIPTKGFDVKIMLENGRKFINDDRLGETTDRSYPQTIIRADARGYRPLFSPRQILSIRLQGFTLESQEYLETDLFRFGGAKSMRGYREEQFRASRAAWGELEFRYLLDRQSYLFGFGSGGYYLRPTLLTETGDGSPVSSWLRSTGGGIAYQTPFGLLKFTYAISPDDPITNGKVHVGITAGI